MEEVLEQTAAAILGLDPDYSTQQVSEDTSYRQHSCPCSIIAFGTEEAARAGCSTSFSSAYLGSSGQHLQWQLSAATAARKGL